MYAIQGLTPFERYGLQPTADLPVSQIRTGYELAAAETVKIAAWIGDTLTGWLASFDLRAMTFRKIRIHRRAGCEMCDSR